MITSLQIGSGKPEGVYRDPEWVNVDVYRPKPRGRFVQASGTALPFRAGRFARIHAIHVLEHLPRDAHLPMLREIARVLAPGGGGFAWIEVPDFLAVVRLLVRAADAGEHEEARIRTVGVYGKGRHHGDFHHWGFAPWYLESLLHQAELRCARETEMISGHWRQEPVLLFKAWHG